MESIRNDDYAYRIYDEKNIKRLQQIIILRKLQIPVKQIRLILDKPDAATAIELFKSNILELENEISALVTIKSALEIFVTKIEEIAAVKLSLDVLTDDTVLELADSLSLSQKNVNENKIFDELNKASEKLEKMAENSVRIVYRPPATIAYFRFKNSDITPTKGQERKEAEAIMQKFIEDTNLFKLKPDLRVFGFNNWDIWVTIPDDLEVPPPFKKYKYYPGGLYAACTNHDFDLGKWVSNSDKYDWSPYRRAVGDEYVNPFNIYGLKNTASETAPTMYTEIFFPIKEKDSRTAEEKERLNKLLEKAEQLFAKQPPVEINLTKMVKRGEADIEYNGSLMEFKASKYNNGTQTPQKFSLPLKIETRLKAVGGQNIGIRFNKSSINFDWYKNKNGMATGDITGESYPCEWEEYKLDKPLPTDDFITAEWILDKNVMVFKVNNEIWYIGDGDHYIYKFKENPEHNLSSEISIIAIGGDVTVTVESLKITEF